MLSGSTIRDVLFFQLNYFYHISISSELSIERQKTWLFAFVRLEWTRHRHFPPLS